MREVRPEGRGLKHLFYGWSQQRARFLRVFCCYHPLRPSWVVRIPQAITLNLSPLLPLRVVQWPAADHPPFQGLSRIGRRAESEPDAGRCYLMMVGQVLSVGAEADQNGGLDVAELVL